MAADLAACSDAYEVDEGKDTYDKARAIEIYAWQARNVEAERPTCEIRLRAERRCGQLLREMAKARPGDRQKIEGRIRPACSASSCSNGIPDDTKHVFQKPALGSCETPSAESPHVAVGPAL